MFYSDNASTRSEGIRDRVKRVGYTWDRNSVWICSGKALKPLIVVLSEGIRLTKLW